MRVQNLLLLQSRMGDESHSTMHVHAAETVRDNKALLCSATVTSVNGGLVLDHSSMPLATGKLGCRESTAHLSWSKNLNQPIKPLRSLTTETTHNLKIASGLNASVAPFTVHDQELATNSVTNKLGDITQCLNCVHLITQYPRQLVLACLRVVKVIG